MTADRLFPALVLACALLAAGPGCSVELAPPPEARLHCTQDGQCPTGYACRVLVERCVRQGGEQTVPELSAVTLSKTSARSGDAVELRFSTNVPLFAAPAVVLQAGQTRALELTGSGADGYVYRLLLRGDEGDGTWPIVTELLSAGGVNSPQLTLGSLRLDFELPRTVGPVLADRDRLGPGQQVAFSFSASEPLAGLPALELFWPADSALAPVPASCSAAEGVANGYLCTASIGSTGAQVDTLGAVAITLKDLVGNPNRVTTTELLTLDVTAPQLNDGFTYARLIPGAGNPLSDVLAAASGTSVELSFQFDEQLAAPPAVLSRPSGLVFTRKSSLATTFVYALSVPSAATLGLLESQETVEITAADLYGNSATRQLRFVDAESASNPYRFTVDTRPPASAPVDEPEAFTYFRAPHGSLLAPGSADFWLELDPTLLAEPSTLFVTDRADFAHAAILGTARLDPSVAGTRVVELLPPDRSTVYLHLADAAGNLSPGVAVRDVVWAATLRGKELGDDFANPHRFTAHRRMPTGATNVGDEFDSHDSLGEIDGTGPSTLGAASWEHVSNGADQLTLRTGATMVLDPTRLQPLLIGGRRKFCQENSNQLFALRNGTWAEEPLAAELLSIPEPRAAADTRRSATVLVGLDGVVWELAAGTWRQSCSTAACLAGRPVVVPGFALVFDKWRDVTVLINPSAGELETWEWDGAGWARGCTEAACLASAPPSRSGMAAVFDEQLGEVLIFGGSVGDAETWSFDGRRWTQRCVEEPCLSARPPGRSLAQMAYDPVRDEVVLFGGRHTDFIDCVNGTPVDQPADTWSWDGAGWTNVNPPVTPPGRAGHAMAFDPGLGKVVMSTGQEPICSFLCPSTMAPYRGDTWLFDGTTWAQLPAIALPPATRRLAMAFSPEHQGVVMYGGGQAGAGGLGGLWKWIGHGWIKLFSSAAVHEDPEMAEHQGATYLYGGTVNNTPSNALRKLGASSWQTLTSFGTAGDACMASTGDALMVHGGAASFFQMASPETYSYSASSNSATRVCDVAGCTPIPTNSGAKMVPLPGGRLLAYGGVWNGLDDHLWTGSGWSAPAAGGPSPGRTGHYMTFSQGRAAALMVGGEDRFAFTPETVRDPSVAQVWEGDGDTWARLELYDSEGDGSPGPVAYGAMAYDPNRRLTVLYGGNADRASGTTDVDTWILRDGHESAPGHLFEVRSANARMETDSTLLGYEVDWYGEAQGHQGGQAVDGLGLSIWNGTRWVELTATQAQEGARRLARWSSAGDPATSALGSLALRGFLSGAGQSLRVAAHPRGTNGTMGQWATLTSDYPEIRLRYRRPAQ